MYRLLFLITLLFAGCYDSSFGEADTPSDAPTPTTTIAALQARYQGGYTLVEGEVVIEGRVTANTLGGNFYRSLVVEQEGAGVEILIGLDALHSDFPIGARLLLDARGLALERAFGVLRIGARAAVEGDRSLGYLASKAQVDQHLFRADDPLITPIPRLVTIGQLTPTMAGQLICIEGLFYTPDTPTEQSWSGYRRFTDEEGSVIFTYVRTYAAWAAQPLPTGRCTLVGILQYDAAGEGRFILKPRYEQDIW